jgi:hypothetical protein
MPEGTVNYRIFAALEENAAFDMFQSYGLFDPEDSENFDVDFLGNDELDFESSSN